MHPYGMYTRWLLCNNMFFDNLCVFECVFCLFGVLVK